MKIKKYCSFLFCIMLLFSSYNVSADKTGDLQNKKSSNQSEMNTIKNKINEAQQNKSTYTQKKKVIDSQLEAANQKLYKLNMRISSLQSDINAKQNEIDGLTGQQEKANELFKERMRALYEDNSLSYVDVILNSESISDFFYRLDVVKQVSDYDQNIIKTIVNKKEVVADAQKTLVTKQDEVKTVQQQAQSEQSNIQKLQMQNQAVINDINSNISAYEQQLKARESENARIENQIKSILAAQKKAEQETAQKASGGASSSTAPSSQTASASGFLWPCPASRTVTSPFGKRVHPLTHTTTMHNGIDIGGPNGTSIVASKAGSVIVSEYSSSYGNYIIISHGGGQTTTYAHLSARLVSVGASVSQGQTIGREGSTGWSTGPHLHFEVAINGVRYNPLNYVK